MDNLKRKLESSIRWYNDISKKSYNNKDPVSYTAFLLGQKQAYEKVLKYIYNKEIESKKVFDKD
ncbi:MAG: hypothetical protein WCR40_02210 [Candidatus Paceibacterota bacterium]|jgi:hypothetical protein